MPVGSAVVRRLKNGLSVEHPIAGDELRAIKRYLATRTDQLLWGIPVRARTAPDTLVGGVSGSGRRRNVGLQGVHPHMLRHSCGYYLADRGTDLRTTQDSGIATSGTPFTTRAWPGVGSKGCGNSW
jgi:type 1 fimbriae regulatory protein FimB